MDITTISIAAIGGLILGIIIAKLLEKGRASKTIGQAKKDASAILKNAKIEGESIKKDKIFQAKEKLSRICPVSSWVMPATEASWILPFRRMLSTNPL